MVVTSDEFIDWRGNPITREFFKGLKKWREDMKEDHICGRYDNKEFAEGKARALLDLIEMDYNEFLEVISVK